MLKDVFAFILPNNKKDYLFAVILLLISTGAAVASPYFIMRILDNALSFQGLQLFYINIGLALLCNLLQYGSKFGSDYLFEKIGRRFTSSHRKKVLSHVSKFSGSELITLETGDTYTVLFEDIENVRQIATKDLINFLSDIMMSLGMLVFLLWIQPDIVLIVVLLQSGVFIFQRICNRKMEHYGERARNAMGSMASFSQQLLSNLFSIILLHSGNYFLNRFAIEEEESARTKMRLQNLISGFSNVLNIFSSLITLIILGYGGYKVMMGALTIGGLVTFNIYSQRLISPITRASQYQMTLTDAYISWNRVSRIMNTPIPSDSYYSSHIVNKFNDFDIQFCNVQFHYAEDTVISKFNLRLDSDQTHAIVGESGSGKSTLVNLLLRLWEPSRGEIRIDGRDIRDLPINSLRDLIGIVNQNTFLFNDSIYNNIVIGRENITEQDVVDALKRADIYDFVQSLPGKIHTIVGEQGIKLSGGQKQRISIARALLGKNPILILDEATSMLDNFSEEKIMSKFLESKGHRLKIIIAHRLSTITKADVIHVIHEGRVVEEGTHFQLMEYGGYYYRLFTTSNNMQTEGEINHGREEVDML